MEKSSDEYILSAIDVARLRQLRIYGAIEAVSYVFIVTLALRGRPLKYEDYPNMKYVNAAAIELRLPRPDRMP
jgi:hypothetical protein